MMKDLKTKKKKKGFTLIELIAVVAILAILAAILVPRIAGYRARAVISSAQSDAKTVLNAIQLYNADNDATVDSFSKITTNPENYLDVINPQMRDLTIEKLTYVSEGKSPTDGKIELTVAEAKTLTDDKVATANTAAE